MLTKEKKKEIVSDLGKALADSKSVVFVNFHGITVADSSIMRRKIKTEGVDMKVARKTLIKRVLDAANVIGERPEFKGELAVAYLSSSKAQEEDLVAPARGIYEFQKKLDGKVKILGGIFEGKYMSAVEMTEIASIPALDVLRGMFVNIINSPIQRFATVLGQVADLGQVAEKKS
jgi:large subunit ribosomal protein L10